MTYQVHILLGRIAKVHGFQGAVTVRLEKTFTENIPGPESVFIEIEGKPVPFFISDAEYPGGDIIWLKFTGYESIDKVSEFTGCRIFLTSEKSSGRISGNITDLIGYKIQQADKKTIGSVNEIIDNPEQLLLCIITGEGKEMLIPLHEDLIIKTDNRKKIITMVLPEGLTEIN